MFEAALDKLEWDMKRLKRKQQKYAPNLNILFSDGNRNESTKSINNFGYVDKTERQKEEQFKPAPVNTRLVPPPPGTKGQEKIEDDLLDERIYGDPFKPLKRIVKRKKRSSTKKSTGNKHDKRSIEKTNKKRHTRNIKKSNDTIKFYSTVDELNEDTLQHYNVSGTLPAKKMDLKVLPDMSRRSNFIDRNNKSLHIEFNDHNHITDNKIDIIPDHENKFNLSHEKFNMILGNHTQQIKDKELSKLVVNELKPGNEIVGDNNAPVTSNITFTLENDTLTAMAYIAGNLLNKLWTMEKDSTGSTLETADMKHEKISELLDLFKEPLNLRQEKFLKSVLERLSSAIDTDKDVKNVTICQTIEEATKLIHNFDNSDEKGKRTDDVQETTPCEVKKKEKNNKVDQYATAKAISKINTVLNLLKTFENIHNNLSTIKNASESNNITDKLNKKLVIDAVLKKPEANSLNVYGNILDKIVKVLLPKQDSNKINNAIRQNSMLNDDENFRNHYMKIFKSDISNMTITAKDKIIMDYLTHINSKPDCVLNKIDQNSMKSLPTIQGNILLNLSEFFKIKSMTDLINMIEPVKATIKTNKSASSMTTTKPVESITVNEIKNNTKLVKSDNSKQFASTKEKLKAHLRTIIEDLIELQEAKGIHTRSNIRIADALPCIYNIMNAGKDILNKNNNNKINADSIVEMFNELRIDMRRMKTRRSDSILKVRPKSAVVLERVIKNLGQVTRSKTRRLLNERDVKPFEEVKHVIYKLRNISSGYKNEALYKEVPAVERLVLLKTFHEETKNYITALEGIKQEFNDLSKLTADQFTEIDTFISSSASNISLDEKVMEKVEKGNQRKHYMEVINFGNTQRTTASDLGTLNVNDYKNDMTISRQEIINHLIKKRVETYLKLKEAREFNVENNMNYNIGKRILFYLNVGNYNLAHELFKMLVMQKDGDSTPTNIAINNFAVPTLKPSDSLLYQAHLQRPVMFEEPKILENESKFMSQDHLIKQLLNIKNMGV